MAKSKSTSSNKKIKIQGFDGLTDEQINNLPSDEFADRMMAEMDSKKEVLSFDDMDVIEARWEKERSTRRCSLVMLTKSFKWLSEATSNDKGFAECVAEVHLATKDLSFYKGMVELLEVANTWTMLALVGREDMSELLASASKEETAA